jgi:hypothetical protein
MACLLCREKQCPVHVFMFFIATEETRPPETMETNNKRDR